VRLVALGASNLKRGLHTLVGEARRAWGADTRLLAALGYGRSYGQTSRFLLRSLPGILDCGLWRSLAASPAEPTRALVTDVGNDILYGQPPEQVLTWVASCVDRLLEFTPHVTITGLPLAGIRGLTPARYLLFRTLFVPSCRLSLAETQRRSERVAEGLVGMAARRSLRLVRLRPEWYGLDPIHFRPAAWAAAWWEIAGCPGTPAASTRAGRGAAARAEALRLYLAAPERMTLVGFDRRRRQPVLPGVELY
jgi:hypothetical protein